MLCPQDSLLFSSLPGVNMNLQPMPLGDFQQAGHLRALLAPAGGLAIGPTPTTLLPQRQMPEYNPWGTSLGGFETQLSFEDPRQQQGAQMDGALFKAGGYQQGTVNSSRLGNLQYSSTAHGLAVATQQHGAFPGKLPVTMHNLNMGFCMVDSLSTADSYGSSQQQWDENTSSPYRGTLIGTYRAQELRDSSASSSPFGSYTGSPRGVDFRNKRNSGSANGVSSPRTPPHGSGGHRIGIDPRLVVGSPLEIAWEVLQQSPGLAALLNLQPSTAKLRNVSVQEDDEPEVPHSDSTAAAREPEVPLSTEQLIHEQGLVRSCRGLPARVRDDLIKAARLAVTRCDSSGRELPGTGLLPFFWRVQTNLKWLLQQPATLKGQLLPGQIDFITEEQRAQSFQKTVQQRVRLGELAVMLHTMLQPAEGHPVSAGSSA